MSVYEAYKRREGCLLSTLKTVEVVVTAAAALVGAAAAIIKFAKAVDKLNKGSKTA
jgi:hypothetical protein